MVAGANAGAAVANNTSAEHVLTEGERIVRMPETVQGDRVLAMLEAINSNEKQQLEQFFSQHCCTSADLRKGISAAKLNTLRGMLKGASVVSIETSDDRYRLELRSPQTEDIYLVTVGFSSTEELKIADLMVE